MEDFAQTKPNLYQLPAILSSGSKIKINGFLPEDADRATVNLQCSPHAGDEPTDECMIALHLDIRCDDSIVRNHFENGWGDEEADENAIAGGQPIEIEIFVHDDSYEINVNGTKYTFSHRLNKDEIKYIFVHHDISVSSVNVNGHQLERI